jgi:hypothetical protein
MKLRGPFGLTSVAYNRLGTEKALKKTVAHGNLGRLIDLLQPPGNTNKLDCYLRREKKSHR